MEKISQLMDGELGRRECKQQIERVGGDPGLNARWDTYHLIRDVLRNECDLPPDFTRRIHERLEQEPIMIAPHQSLPHRLMRQSIPLAAGVAGVIVIAIIGSSLPWGLPGGIRNNASTALVVTAPATGTITADGQVSEYVLAHQEFSPRTAMQGVASYVRTVPASASDSAE